MSGGRFVREALIAGAFLVGTIVVLKAVRGAMPPTFAYADVIQLSLALLAVVGFTGQLWLRARKREGSMARLAALAAPLIVSTAFAAYRDIITYYFQSFTTRGVFSDIEYARRIVFVPTTVVAYALSVAMFPYLCELASGKDHKDLGRVITKAIRMLALGFVPLTVMTIILSDPVSRLVLDRGDWASVHLHYTGLALALLGVGLLMYAWEYVIMQGYFSLQRMWTPALMGIAGTFFQFGFLAIPIYVFAKDYPVQIFFLAALAYPVSRYFKNLILLGILRRRVPVLPFKESAGFALKLAILTAGVGLATWGCHRLVRERWPMEPYRQRKVVVDNFETGPDSWFSLNAREIGIAPAPGEGEGLAVRMSYNRHGDVHPSLYRRIDRLAAAGPLRLEFAAMLEQPAERLVVELEGEDGRERVFNRTLGDAPAGSWQSFTVDIASLEGIEGIHWLEAGNRPEESNILWIDDVILRVPETGEVFWGQNFDANGWRAAEGTSASVADSRAEGETPRYALALAEGKYMKSLASYDLSETTVLRVNVRNDEDRERTVSVVLSGPTGEPKVAEEEVPPHEWRTFARTWEELGYESAEAFRRAVRLTIESPGEGVWVDDVTLRRPARRTYEVIKLIHCTLPTLAGLIVGALLGLLLKFEEIDDVVSWVKQRGWQREKEDVEEMMEEDERG
jgi:hypothetical protein